MILKWNLAAASILSLVPVAEGLVLPSPLALTHNVMRLSDSRHGRRHSVNGPLNVMSTDHMDTTESQSGSLIPDPIDTTIVDANSLDAIDWVDAAEVAAHVEGTAAPLHKDTPAEVAMKRPIVDYLPTKPLEIEEEVMIIRSPDLDEPSTLAAAPQDIQEEIVAPHSKINYVTVSADHPSIKKIIQFSLPAIGVWLCSPVLSMIDTASVGLLAGTAQQAALNPAVSVTDYGALLVAFMYTATTNLIAGAVEKDSADTSVAGQPRTAKTLVTALRLALLVGISFGTILGSFAPLLLKGLIGNSTLDPVVFQSALRYVQIRSLGMPAAVVIGTAQSACLGMKDVKSPLYVLAAAAGINLIADIVLVPSASPWFGGAAGAAWATVFSQYGALIMFLRWLTVKSKNDESGETMNPMDMIKDTTKEAGKSVKVTFGNALEKGTTIRKNLFSSKKQSKPEKEKNDALARGFLSHSHKAMSILNPLRLSRAKSTIKKFIPFVVPVTTTSIGRVSGFLTMSHVASSAFGTLDMAAHQIAISIFCCLAPVVDALNQVAQSFVPGIFARPKSRERALALRNTSVNFAKVGALFGASIAALVTIGIPVVSKGFTTDPAVLSRIKNAIPGIAIFLGFDGLMCIGEGTLLGQNDLKFLRNMYASFFFLVPAFMFRLKRRALSGIEVGIGTMWLTFSAYEVVRTILWLARVVFLQRKMDKEVDEMEAEAAAVTAV